MLKDLHCFIYEDKPKCKVELKIEVYKIIIRFFIINYNSKSHFAYFYFRARNGLQKEHLELKQDKGHTGLDAKQKTASWIKTV